jgi:hypothetical protein
MGFIPDLSQPVEAFVEGHPISPLHAAASAPMPWMATLPVMIQSEFFDLRQAAIWALRNFYMPTSRD